MMKHNYMYNDSSIVDDGNNNSNDDAYNTKKTN